jgi:spore germination cell wall hydrolase CwlJ-like protein
MKALAVLLFAAALFAVGAARAQDCAPAEDDELACLALNVYWETRGRPRKSQLAIAHTTLNRVANPDFPGTICEVVHQGGERRGECQFGWWCDGKADDPKDGEAWCDALGVARQARADPAADPTGGALYYHRHGRKLAWTKNLQPLGRIGHHEFYK